MKCSKVKHSEMKNAYMPIAAETALFTTCYLFMCMSQVAVQQSIVNQNACRSHVGIQEIPGVKGKIGLGVQNEAGQRLTEFC